MNKTLCAAACLLLVGACAAPEAYPPTGPGHLAVSANDNKAVLVNGVTTAVANPAPDTVAIIDLRFTPPRVVAEIEAPASVVGPPLSVAVAPGESVALVTPAEGMEGGKPGPDNKGSWRNAAVARAIDSSGATAAQICTP